MKFSVEWAEKAENDLAGLWLEKSVRDSLTKACQIFESRLSHNPEAVGESRERGFRIDFELPFAIIFRCDSAAKKVTIGSIWATR